MEHERIDESPDYAAFCRGLLADPYPLYARLRDEEPVHWSSAAASWILTRYDDVAAVLKYDGRSTANRLDALIAQLPPDVRSEVRSLHGHLSTFVQYYDPPDHARLRATAGWTFTPRVVSGLRDQIQSMVDSLITQMEASGTPDLVRDFAYPLPASVIAEVVGVPVEDRDRFKRWADEIGRFLEGVGDGYSDVARSADEAVRELETYIAGLVDVRKDEPGQDFLSSLVAEDRAGRLSEAELFGWCMFLLLAGHETTTGLIANGIEALLEHPAQAAELRADPALASMAIEELLRYDSPVQRISRIALKDHDMGDRRIHGGDRLWAMIGAANRDPEVFVDPDRLDVRRHPNRHLAFGFGVHFCLGAPLARLQGEIAITTLIARWPAMRRTDSAGPRWAGVSLRRVESLPVAIA